MIIDNIAMINSVVMPFIALPQILKIYRDKIVDGVSALTWALYSVSCFVMLLYGIAHALKELIVLNGLCVVVNLIVVYGIIKGNNKKGIFKFVKN